MNDDTPHVVNLQSSSELDGFLSEFPSEGEGSRVQHVLPPPGEPLAQVGADDTPVERETAPVTRKAAAFAPSAHDAAPTMVETSSPAAPEIPVEVRSATRSATVTEFPVHATRPPTPTVAALVPSPVTLVDLLERQGGLEWRRAVAVIHQICGLLKQQPSHQPILLEPRNILITHDGQVRLLPALSSGDPLVIQLGRLLRTMMTGNDAPPELRLLLAQATFELPIFESVEDVDRALVQLERLEEDGGSGKGFMNPIVTLPPTETARPTSSPAARAGRSILPKPHTSGRRAPNKSSFVAGLYSYGLWVAAVALIAAGLTALMMLRPALLWPNVAPVSTDAAPAIAPPIVPSPSPASDQPVERASAPQPVPPLSNEAAARAPVTIPAPPLVPVPDMRSRQDSVPTSSASRRAVEPHVSRSVAARNQAATSGTTPSPRESERRAASLIAQGQTAQASIVFDALLLSNPLYEPDPTSLTPEAHDAFRASQRTLLPHLAQKNFERARAALASGDAERALALGREVAGILDRRVAESPPHLREQVDELIDAATAAKSQTDEIVYTAADKGVVAPRELSRQFPASTPLGVPPHRVGTLEMIIDKDGSVEFVKLFTPLNRYHERMIVSAAKAWRYRPATRNGKPVKYRLTVRINLPESGTDF